MIQMDTHQNLQYKYPQAPSCAQGPKILATATQKKYELHSTFRVIILGIGLGFHGSTAPENT